MNSKKFLVLLFVLMAVFLIISSVPLAMYYYYFNNSSYSDDPEQWGQFGDYVGGVLNPILSLTNLIVTSFIAVEIYKVSKKQLDYQSDINKSQISTQKELLLTQFRYDLVTEFKETMDGISLKLDIIILKNKNDDPQDAMDELLRLLNEMRNVDQSILQIDEWVTKIIIETINETEIWKSGGRWWDEKSKYLSIKHNTDIVIRSLLSHVLVTTR